MAALAFFAAVNLLTSLALPMGWGQRSLLLIGPILSAAVVLAALPFLLGLFEKQDDSIAQQKREIDTLHAMDTAITSQMEIGHVLAEAVRQTLRALDAEAGGVFLLGIKPEREALIVSAPDRNEADTEAFCETLRSGGKTKSALCEILCVPVQAGVGQKEANAETPVLGYLAAARFTPCRPFLPSDSALVNALGGTTAVAVVNARALAAARETAKIQAELTKEKRVAEALTQALLPDIPPRAGIWAFSRRYLAQSSEAQVGGDIYDLFRLGETRWGVVLADVSGKGLAAATKTAMVKYCLRSYAREHASPSDVMARLNDTLFDEPDMTGFVTVVYGVFDEARGDFSYASAGHEPLLLRRKNGEMEELAATGLVCGVMQGADYEDKKVLLEPGDGVLLYTDGLSEARNAEGEFLNTDGAKGFLRDLLGTPAGEIADAIVERVRVFSGEVLADDTAVVWMERVG